MVEAAWCGRFKQEAALGAAGQALIGAVPRGTSVKRMQMKESGEDDVCHSSLLPHQLLLSLCNG